MLPHVSIWKVFIFGSFEHKSEKKFWFGDDMKNTKAPVVLFIGAGASAPIGFPTTKQFMKEIGLEPVDVAKLGKVTEHTAVLQKIYASLPPKNKDLEGILDYLRIINDPTSIIGINILKEQINVISGITPEIIKAVGTTIKKFLDVTKILEEDIKKQLFKFYIFQTTKHKAITQKIYRPIIDLFLVEQIFGKEINELPVFTTNYDLVIENLMRMSFMRNYEFIDGFRTEHGSRALVFSIDEYEKTIQRPTIKLFKLHGSLNWWNRNEDNRIIQFPDLTSYIDDPNYEGPVMIYPAGYGPYPRDEFHIMHDYLERYLTNAEVCVVIGFSFRDIGIINHYFDDVMKYTNTKLRVIISNMSDSIEKLPETKDLFSKYENRYTYLGEGIEKLPAKLKGETRPEKPTPKKEDKTPKEPI